MGGRAVSVGQWTTGSWMRFSCLLLFELFVIQVMLGADAATLQSIAAWGGTHYDTYCLDSVKVCYQ